MPAAFFPNKYFRQLYGWKFSKMTKGHVSEKVGLDTSNPFKFSAEKAMSLKCWSKKPSKMNIEKSVKDILSAYNVL